MTEFPKWKQPNTFDALDDESTAGINERYPTSKLLEVLIVRQIALKPACSGVTPDMLNPGLCRSEFARDGGKRLPIMKTLLARTTANGSRTLVAAAVARSESHGKYMTDAKGNDGALSEFVKSGDGKKVGE
jgi:hypothetical protein